MYQRIQHEVAFQAAKQSLAVVSEAIHPYVHRDAFEEFYEIIKEALRTYQERVNRMNARLHGSVRRETDTN